MKYWNEWRQLAKLSFSTFLAHRLDSGTFFIGKLVRAFGFGAFIYAIFYSTPNLGGYSRAEALIFFLTFNLIDTVSQAFWRGIYNFGHDVNRGVFDFTLTKPINALFYSLMRTADILDGILLLLYGAAFGYVLLELPQVITRASVGRYVLMFICGILLSLTLHIFSAALSLFTLQSENIIWLYRRTMMVGYFPDSILPVIWQMLFTYILPVIIIVSYPARALLSNLNIIDILRAWSILAVFLIGSLYAWKYALRRYDSASS